MNFDLDSTHLATFSSRSSSLFELRLQLYLGSYANHLFLCLWEELNWFCISCTSKNRKSNTDFANSSPLFNLLPIANFQNTKLFYNSCFGKFICYFRNNFDSLFLLVLSPLRPFWVQTRTRGALLARSDSCLRPLSYMNQAPM